MIAGSFPKIPYLLSTSKENMENQWMKTYEKHEVLIGKSMGNYGEILYNPPYKWMNIEVTIGKQWKNHWNNMDKSSIILDEHGDFRWMNIRGENNIGAS